MTTASIVEFLEPRQREGAADLPIARSVALDRLRAFITLMVVAHHAALAYVPYAPPPGAFGQDLVWGAFPVVDPARAPGLDLLVGWNDSFFMALMFLLAGLFTGPGLLRKGCGRYLRDRGLRLGLPFLCSALALAPLAYYPAYLQRAAATAAPGFWSAWFHLGTWPAGPAWFLWVLLAFGTLAALVWRLAPGALRRLADVGDWCRMRPARACAVLAAGATLTYVGATRVVSPFTWFTWGVFTVQTARVLLYAFYFAFGLALGLRGPDPLAAYGGRLASRWLLWASIAGSVFVAFMIAFVAAMARLGQGGVSLLEELFVNGLFAVSGAVTCFALLAGAGRWLPRGGALATSLSRNAYAIYLLHYAIVTWLQYWLVGWEGPGLAKMAIVTAAGIGLSWIAAACIRRIPRVVALL